MRLSSLPARGAWIEICYLVSGSSASGRRSPHGERGLKSAKARLTSGRETSLPARGAWIEMAMSDKTLLPYKGRSPHGERGLKYVRKRYRYHGGKRRSPHGERGLKLDTRMNECLR